MEAPPIQYCRTDDGVNIAYWTIGDGPAVVPIDSVVMTHPAMEWDVPAIRKAYQGLSETFRVMR